jgi:hypothetical protein
MKTKTNVDKESQKRISELSNEELIKVAFIESAKYREEVGEFAKAEVKKRGLPEIPVKHCPNCERPVPPEQDICVCGYNFEEPNMELIERIKLKRFRKKQIDGLVMVIIGVIGIIILLLGGVKKPSGIPGILIVFGIYKIFFGNSHEKDDLPYMFCPRCRKQLLIELKYKHCPNCGYNLK